MSGSISSAGAVPCNKAEQCVPSSAPWEAEISVQERRLLQERLYELLFPGCKSPLSSRCDKEHPKDSTNTPIYSAHAQNDPSDLKTFKH